MAWRCGLVAWVATSACGDEAKVAPEVLDETVEVAPEVVDEVADTSPEAIEDATPEVEVPVGPLPDVAGLNVLVDENPDPRIVEVSLRAAPHTVAITPNGKQTKMLNYNESFPGPLLHARVGDRVIVHFENGLDEPTTIHWHGLRITDQMDGSPMIQHPVLPGESFTYDFVVPDAGTFWYHTHLHQIEQLERGLYGAIVVHEAAPPAFSAERIVVVDDIRLDANDQISPFVLTGPDLMAGRVGNFLLANGQPGALTTTIPKGGIERWRMVLASNALAFGVRIRGADVKLIATDGGLLPQQLAFTRAEIAAGQRYEFEVRPKANATEVVLEAMVDVVDAQGTVSEQPFVLLRATVEGEVATPEPVYPTVTLPVTRPLPDWIETVAWELSAQNVGGKVQFTINGTSDFVDTETEPHEHVLLHTFEPNVPVLITLTSSISPAHPFHIHGQFFQILQRGGTPVTNEPGLKDTVELRGGQSVKILTYMENPGRWMVHCHISEHAENGMMADIQVGPPGGHDHGGASSE